MARDRPAVTRRGVGLTAIRAPSLLDLASMKGGKMAPSRAALRPRESFANRIRNAEQPRRFILEQLEQRVLLAISWDGGGNGTHWDDPFNWNTDSVPGPGDDVRITRFGTYSIQLHDDTALASLSIGNLSCSSRPTLETSGMTLRVVTNAGTGASNAPTWRDEIYLSTDQTFDATDVKIGSALNPN